MRLRTLPLAFAITTLASLVTTLSAGQTGIEEAKKAIRLFEGLPNLPLPEPKVEYNTSAPIGKVVYVFRLPNGQTYHVDKETGYIIAVIYPSNWRRVEKNPISSDQAIQIARQFAAKKSVIYQKYRQNMVADYNELSDHFVVTLTERLPTNGALTYNKCIIGVSKDGSVIFFQQGWDPSPHPDRHRKPTVSAIDAGHRVASQLGFRAWDFAKKPQLLSLPARWSPFSWRTSSLVWSLDIVGDGRLGVRAFVDALTGHVLMISKYRISSLLPQVFPPKIYVNPVDIKSTSHISLDAFILKGVTPIIKSFDYSSKYVWLPLMIFQKFGAQFELRDNKLIVSFTQIRYKWERIVRSDGSVIIVRHQLSPRYVRFTVKKFMKYQNQIYLPAKLLEEWFPDKVVAVTTHREGWVRILTYRRYLKLFADLREDIVLPGMKLHFRVSPKNISLHERGKGTFSNFHHHPCPKLGGDIP